MKIIKIAFSIIIAVILLLIVATIVLPQFIDPNDYKTQIAETIKQKTGLEATIDGDLSLSVFPWLGVSTGHIVLKQPAVITQSVPKAGDFVDVDAIDIKVKLKPLFSRKVEVDTIVLKKPRIEFIVNTKGQNSLSGLSQAATASTPSTAEAATASNNAASIAALTIAGANISDGQLIFDDRQTNTRYELAALNITSGNILESSAPFSIAGVLSGNAIAPITFSLDSELTLNKDTMAVSINNIVSTITQEANRINTKIETIDYQHASASSTLKNLRVDAQVANYPLALAIPTITIDLNKTLVNIPAFTATSNGVDLSGNIDIKDWNKVPLAIGQIQSKPFNLQKLLTSLAIDYTPTKSSALENVALSSNFNASANGASLQNIKLIIDNTTLEGDVAIMNFTAPNYRFDLSLSEIIVDDYLPLATETNSQTNTKLPTATEALAAPIVLLKDIHANGTFRAKKITANKLTLSNNVITVASTTSTVTISPTLDLYKGRSAGTITLQRGKTPTLLINNVLSNVDLEPLLTDAEVTDQLSGIANINANIAVSEKAGKPSSKGTVVVSAKNGAIKGVNIKKVLDDAQGTIDKLRGKTVTPSTNAEKEETRFAEMTATLLIDNDIINNNDLTMKAPAFRINGEGSVNTASQTLDYLTSIVVVNTNSGQGGENLSDLKGLTIPVRFTGSLNAPKYKIDTKALLKANTGQSAEKEKDKLKDKLLDKLGIEKTKTDSTTNVTTTKTDKEVRDELKKKLLDKLF